jgi:hypothetical protein
MAKAKEVPNEVKELRITPQDGETGPSFAFTGSWNGHDVSAIIRNIRREYLRYTRDIRRTESSEPSTSTTKEEAK